MKKAVSTGNNMKMDKGSSILEVLIAISILTLAISAAVMISFASQSVEVDTETSHEALFMAKEILEDARADSRENFLSVNTSVPEIETSGIPYTKQLQILDDTACRKTATSTVTWNVSPLRPITIELTTILGDIAGVFALGGDCDIEPIGDWDNPYSPESDNIIGQSNATDIDIQDNFVYITTDPSAPGKDDFFIYEFDPVALTLTPRGALDISIGVNAVDVAGNYAYLANASTTGTESSEELVIIDITDKDNPSPLPFPLTLGITPNCPSFCPGGAQSIYYLDGRIYIGTHRIGGDEFYVVDVSDIPLTPPSIIRSLNVNHNVNDIVVRDGYAYLAVSDNSGELHVYNVSDPGPISFVDSFDANNTASDDEDGLSLYLIGNKVYLGRERVSNPSKRDFYIVDADITSPTFLSELGSQNLGLGPSANGTVGLVVRGSLAFLAIDDSTTAFKILNISNPLGIVDHTVCTSLHFSENTTAMDMENNSIFIANRSNAEIRLVQDQPSQCAL